MKEIWPAPSALLCRRINRLLPLITTRSPIRICNRGSGHPINHRLPVRIFRVLKEMRTMAGRSQPRDL